MIVVAALLVAVTVADRSLGRVGAAAPDSAPAR